MTGCKKNFPDRADKVWHMIEQSHGGKVNDSRWGVRMREKAILPGSLPSNIANTAKLYGMNAEELDLDTTTFRRPGAQGRLFD